MKWKVLFNFCQVLYYVLYSALYYVWLVSPVRKGGYGFIWILAIILLLLFGIIGLKAAVILLLILIVFA